MSRNLLQKLAEGLDGAALPYMIVGGQAVLLYGEPRMTRDVDITLGATPDRLGDALEVAAQLELRVLVEDVEAFVRQTWVLPALDEVSGLRVDFIFSWTPYEKEAIARGRTAFVSEYPVRFASPEDVIVHKMLAGRPRDMEDIRSILRKQIVDRDYVCHWLKQFDQTLEKRTEAAFEDLWHGVQEEEDPDA